MFYYVGKYTFLAPERISSFVLTEIPICLFTIFSGCFLIFLAFFKSPEFLKVFRVSLLNLTIESTLFAFLIMLVNPIAHIFRDVYCVEILGVLRAPYLVASLTLWLFMSNAMNISIKCLFRYIQIAHDHLSPLLISKPFIAFLSLIHTTILGVAFLFTHIVQAPLPEFNISLNAHFERPLREMRSRNNSFLCFTFSTPSQSAVAVLFSCWFLLCTVAMFVFATLTILKLRSYRRLLLSERTFELQKMMAIVVFVTAAIPFLLGTVPLFVMVAAFEFFPHFLSFWLNVQPFLQNIIFFLLNMVSIVGLRPYRSAVINWGRLLKNKLMGIKNGKVTSVVPRSTTS